MDNEKTVSSKTRPVVSLIAHALPVLLFLVFVIALLVSEQFDYAATSYKVIYGIYQVAIQIYIHVLPVCGIVGIVLDIIAIKKKELVGRHIFLLVLSILHVLAGAVLLFMNYVIRL